MTFFDTSKWTGALLVIGLAACQMDNPAFDGDGQADEVGDSGDTTAGDTTMGESGESGSSSDGNDGSDTSDASDDASDAETDGTDDAIEPDLPAVEECLATFSDPFSPIFGTPEDFNGGSCPAVVTNQYLRVNAAGPAAGLVMAQLCSVGCGECDDGEGIPVGVVGLGDFTAPLLAQVQNQQLTCIKVQTGTFRGIDENARCLYDSMWIGNYAEVDLLLVLHRNSGLPPAGSALLGGKVPPVQGESQMHCSCAGLFEPADPNLECCEGTQADPFVASLSFLDVDVAPGGSDIVALDSTEWTFHVAQAQLLPTCDNDLDVGMDMSWAIVRKQ